MNVDLLSQSLPLKYFNMLFSIWFSLFLCLCAGNCHGQMHNIFSLSICPIARNALRKVLGLTDYRIWWFKVTVTPQNAFWSGVHILIIKSLQVFSIIWTDMDINCNFMPFLFYLHIRGDEEGGTKRIAMFCRTKTCQTFLAPWGVLTPGLKMAASEW